MLLRILQIPAGDDGCAFYRMTLPRVAMEQLGHRVDIATPQVTPSMLLSNYDVVVIQRPIHPGPTRMLREISEIPISLRPMVVVELDDDLWSIHPSNPACDVYNTEALARLQANVVVADLVTVTTPILRDVVTTMGAKRVVVLRNQLPDIMPSKQGTTYQMLWSGSASHRNDFKEHARGIRQALIDNQIPLMLIGAPEFHHTINTPIDLRLSTEWTLDVMTHYTRLRGMIAVAPLVDNRFNASRSEIKFLEYAAMGVPVVASDVPAYQGIVCHGVTGMLVKGHEWRRTINTVMGDSSLRESLSREAYNCALSRRIGPHIHEWVDAYSKVLFNLKHML